MARWRSLAVSSSLALAGAAIGVLPAAATAGGTPRPPAARSQTAACAAVPSGFSTCLVHVWHPSRGRGANSPLHRRRGTTGPGLQAATPSGYGPAVIAKAYGFTTGGGTGETIAIVDAFGDPAITSDLATFDSEYGLPCASCFKKVNQSGGTTYPRSTAGWDLETSLDVEWAHALAPKAHVLLVEANTNSDASLFSAVSYAASQASYVSMSWGGPETSSETTLDSYFLKTGVSFFAASGDTHSEVIYPSSSPDVVSVGGTTLNVKSTGAWSSETAWSTAGGGCSRYESASPPQATYPTYDQANATCAGKRAAPDISLDANPSTGVAVYDSVTVTGLTGWIQVGGTSASTVMVASHAAETGNVVDAARVYGTSLKIYNVTTGSNGHPCETGYNLCTGLGSWNTAVGTVRSAPAGTLRFATSPQKLTAGRASTAIDVSLSAAAPAGGVTVTVSSSSTSGAFSTSAAGPFSASPWTVHVTAGGTTAALYYKDTKAGSPTLTAAATGWSSASQTETVGAAALARITVAPTSATVAPGGQKTFVATGYDTYSNPVTTSFDPTWTTTVAGASVTSPGTSTTFTAGGTTGSGTVTASQGTVAGAATVTVTQVPSLTVTVSAGALQVRRRGYTVPLTVHVTSGGANVSAASVTLDVYRGSTCSGTPTTATSGRTGTSGVVSFTFSTSAATTWCAEATATKTGYAAGAGTKTFST